MFSRLHAKALELARRLRSAEAEMVILLQEIDACRGYTELGYPSLFAYATQALGFAEASAYHFITVSRKAKNIPTLQAAIVQGELSVAKAKVIASVVTEKCAAEWVELAQQSTTRELERKVAQEHPETRRVEKVQFRGENQVELLVSLDSETYDLLRRAQEVMVQKRKTPVSLANLIHAFAEAYVDREDPLKKAERAVKRNPSSRTSIGAKHQARLRDRGECQFRMANGQKCKNKFWLDLHHIRPKASGGSDAQENLVTLCAAHHRLVHEPP